MFNSTLIWAVIVGVVTRNQAPAGTVEQELHQPVILVLMLLSLATFAASFSLTRLPWITRWAVIESSAIYGLVAAFITHDWRLYAIGWVLSLIAFAFAFPPAKEA